MIMASPPITNASIFRNSSIIVFLAVVAVVSLYNLVSFDGGGNGIGIVVEQIRRLDIEDINEGKALVSDAALSPNVEASDGVGIVSVSSRFT